MCHWCNEMHVRVIKCGGGVGIRCRRRYGPLGVAVIALTDDRLPLAPLGPRPRRLDPDRSLLREPDLYRVVVRAETADVGAGIRRRPHGMVRPCRPLADRRRARAAVPDRPHEPRATRAPPPGDRTRVVGRRDGSGSMAVDGARWP